MTVEHPHDQIIYFICNIDELITKYIQFLFYKGGIFFLKTFYVFKKYLNRSYLWHANS